ncbi:TPR repeat-containing protein [Calothrix sp. NIES-4071]|nr:TPR repeat-containing protein [Calothrix sp. NIES-4071]BAZ56665.1 TPR repeat-containing protein [Calothrix sp. NIES-4105]
MIDLILSSGLTSFGALLYNFGNYKSAIDNYTLAIQCNPQDGIAYFNRGIAKVMIDEYEAAIEDFNQALQINPQNSQAYTERGIARSMIGNNEAAIEDCSHAIQLNPELYRAYYGRGDARLYTGDIEGAIEDFTYLVSNKPCAFYYYNLACLQYLNNSKAKAIKNFTKAIDYKYEYTNVLEQIEYDLYEILSPTHRLRSYASHYFRSNIFYELSDKEAANEDYQEAIAIEANGIILVPDWDERGFWGTYIQFKSV